MTPTSSTPVPCDLQQLLQESAVLMALYDPADRLRSANAAFAAAFDIDPAASPSWADVLRTNFRHQRGTKISASDFEAWLASAQSRRGKLPFRAFETDLHDGRWLWMTETMQPDGWMLCIATDISQLKASEHAMKQARDVAIAVANTDVLTGIGNRFAFGQALQHHGEVRRRSAGSAHLLFVIDLDGLKLVNDHLGHARGDELIKTLADGLLALTATSGSCFRLGGDEFAIFAAADEEPRLRDGLAHLELQLREQGFELSGISYGVAHWSVDSDDPAEMIRLADHNMYQHKLSRKRGRAAEAVQAP